MAFVGIKVNEQIRFLTKLKTFFKDISLSRISTDWKETRLLCQTVFSALCFGQPIKLSMAVRVSLTQSDERRLNSFKRMSLAAPVTVTSQLILPFYSRRNNVFIVGQVWQGSVMYILCSISYTHSIWNTRLDLLLLFTQPSTHSFSSSYWRTFLRMNFLYLTF